MKLYRNNIGTYIIYPLCAQQSMANKKYAMLFVIMMVLSTTLAGCTSNDDEDDNDNVVTNNNVKIGFLNPLTGPLAQDAAGFTYGATEAIKDLNAAQSDVVFELVEADSGCDGTVAGPAAQTLLDSDVVGVAGAACSGASMAANAILSAAGIPMISYASTNPGLSDASAYPMFYRVVPSDAIQGPAAADMMAFLGVENPAVLHMTNDYGSGFADAIEGAWDGDLCAKIGYSETTTDVSAEITQIDTAGCDAIFMVSYVTDAALILNEIAAQDLDVWAFSGDGPAGEGLLAELTDDSVADGVGVTAPRAGTSYGDFSARYDASGVGSIKQYVLTSYDAVTILGEAYLKDSTNMEASIKAVGTGYEGASGLHTFLDNGDVGGDGYDICVYMAEGADDGEYACVGYWTATGGVVIEWEEERDEMDVMYDFLMGDMTYDDAWDELESMRACVEPEGASNNPCEIVEMTIGDASTFDPADAYDSASGDVIENVFDTLYRYEGDGNGNAIIVPRLATGYTVSEDQLTYTFDLRDDVFFSNGDHMTAHDVVYSWCRVIGYGGPESHVNWILDQSFDCNDADGNHDDMGGENLTVIDDYTFSVTLFAPSSAFVSTIAYTVGAVVNMELCEENRVDAGGEGDDYCHGWMDEAPLGAGTGAYVVDSWVREDNIVLTPNWMYWEEGDFNINRFTSRIVTEASTRLLAFTDGEVDFGSINIEDLTNFCYIDLDGNGEFDEGEDEALTDKPNVQSKDGYVCVYRETFNVVLAAMNLQPAALDDGENNTNTDANSSLVLNHDCSDDGVDENDCNVMSSPALREAISYAFDYTTHRRDTYDNSIAPYYGPIPAGFLYSETQYEVFTYDLEYAESVLDAAGFIRQYDCTSISVKGEPTVVAEAERDGSECRLPNTLRIMANEGNDYRIAMGAQLQEALGSIGIVTDGEAKPWAEYLTMYYTGTFDIRFSGWAPDYLDPDNYWSPFAGSHDIGGDAYGTNYHNEALDALLVAARESTDDSERADLYAQAFELWVEDPNMILVGQYNGVGVRHDDICSAPFAAIGSAHWFDYSKLAMVDGELVGEC
jgi:ABC-type transport system substrate-binding protein/ABC-type branched-subunit amino acid transport system substrate-binding protein